MRLRILGPLEIWQGDRHVPIPAPKQRALLAALVLRANQTVSTDELIERIWGDHPPQSARLTLQGYVLRLRRILQGHGGQSMIVTQPSGYQLSIQPEALDLHHFDRLISDADQAAEIEDLEAEARHLRAALELWRGQPLADVDSDSLRREEGARLTERWAQTVERRIDVDLRRGNHAELIAELSTLVAAYPLRERLRTQLMLALYRSGRQAEALGVYRDARRALVNELGVEPGPELRRMEQAILAADPALDQVTPAERSAPRPSADHRPHTLAPDVPDFVGREAEIEQLMGWLAPDSANTRPVVCALAGMPGVGKTSLAMRVAHQLADRYPDGRIYLDLAGFSGHPVEPSVALERLLRLLGVWGTHLPEGAEHRAELLRDRLHGRRVLLVLDNAVNEAQIRQLIPGEADCSVLVTSRNRLLGLEGSHLIDLDVLDDESGIELLGRIVGPQRALAEREAARTLVDRCGGLPLAVRICGARLGARPAWTLTKLADRLADERQRLDQLAAGDLEVRSSIALSYSVLSTGGRHAFEALAVLDVPDVPLWTVAVLLDQPVDAVEDLVDGLVDAHLLQVSARDAAGQYRYHCHDLVRLFAREQADQRLPQAERAEALVRAATACLELVEEACAHLPARTPRLTRPERDRDASGGWPASLTPAVAALTAAPVQWLEAERRTLLAVVEHAAAVGRPDLCWRLAAALRDWQDKHGWRDDWRRCHQVALRALAAHPESTGGEAEANVRYGLGLLAAAQDRYDEAYEQFTLVVHECRVLGDVAATGRALNALGDVHHMVGRFDEAARCFEEALTAFEKTEDRTGQAQTLLNIGLIHRDQGRRRECLDHLDRSLAAFRALGDRFGEANVLLFRGAGHREWGALAEAEADARGAIELFAGLSDQPSQTRALRLLATVHLEAGQPAVARPLLEECLRAFRAQHDPFGEATSEWGLAIASHLEGDLAVALTGLGSALEVFESVQVRVWQARTHDRIAAVHQDAGRGTEAAESRARAFAIYRELGLPAPGR